MTKKCKKTNCKLFNCGIEVPYFGDANSKIVLVGESPGTQEERLGIPFIGDSGKLLQDCISLVKLSWANMFKANASRCKIDKKLFSIKDISTVLFHCRPKLTFVLNKIKPKLIVIFGDIALRQILKKSGITKNRGSFVWSQEFQCWVFPTFHPAHILRKNFLKPRFINDLQMVKDFVDNNYEPPIISDNAVYYDVDDELAALESLEASVQNWLINGETIGIDTETQGTDTFNPNFVFNSYSLSNQKGLAWQVRLWEESDCDNYDRIIQWPRSQEKARKKIPSDVYIKKSLNYNLKLTLLKNILQAKNIKKYVMTDFDLHVFESVGITDINSVVDIQPLANILDENLYTNASLADLQIGFTDMRVNYKNDFNKTHDKSDMLRADKEDRDGVTLYACRDADVTRQIGLAMRANILKDSKLLKYATKFTVPVSAILHKMGRTGVCLDRERLPETRKEIRKMMEVAEKNVLKCIGKKVKEKHFDKGLKLSRDLLIQDALFSEDGFNLESIKKTKTGDSIDKETRQKLLDKKISKTAYKFITNYEEWAKCHTLITRYLAGFDRHIKSDGRIHAQFTLAVARNGRTNSRNPNLQNNPKRSNLAKKIRQLLVPKKGFIFIATDMAQSELRWMAHVANDIEMIRVFNANEDIHTNTAKTLVEKSGKNWANLSVGEKDMYRRSGKIINFGLIYGMSTKGFIRYAKLEYGLDLTHQEAEKWIHTFFNVLYRQILTYHKNAIESCRRRGFIDSLLGRRRRLFDINCRDPFIRGFAERQAINHPISSPSSDTVLLAAKDIDRLDLNTEEFRNVLFIHDELIYAVKDNSKVLEYAKLIKDKMEHPPLYKDFGIKLRVPLKADIKYGYNLAELKEMDLN